MRGEKEKGCLLSKGEMKGRQRKSFSISYPEGREELRKGKVRVYDDSWERKENARRKRSNLSGAKSWSPSEGLFFGDGRKEKGNNHSRERQVGGRERESWAIPCQIEEKGPNSGESYLLVKEKTIWGKGTLSELDERGRA